MQITLGRGDAAKIYEVDDWRRQSLDALLTSQAEYARQVRAHGRLLPQAGVTNAMPPDVAAAVTAAEDAARSRAVEIIQACSAAGKPYSASDFLRRHLSIDQARFELTFGCAKPWSEIMAAARIGTRTEPQHDSVV